MPLHKRRFQLLLIYAACLLPLVIDGTRHAMQLGSTSPFEWVPASFRPRRSTNSFDERSARAKF